MTRILTALWATFLLMSAGPTLAADPLLVFAAASMTETLNAVGDAYAATGKARPVFSYAASSALAKQVESGAPAALFISADEQWMDYLAERNLIVPPSRTSFLGNSLVLIAPADRPLKLTIEKSFPLAVTLGKNKIALADLLPVGAAA